MAWPRGFGYSWPHISVGCFRADHIVFFSACFLLAAATAVLILDRFLGDHLCFFEVRVLTTFLTIVRSGLHGNSSTREHENVRFGWQNSTKKHYLALEKHKNRSWGGRGCKFKSCHSDQISTAIMIRNSIVKAVLIFCSKALIYKAFLWFWLLVEFQHKCQEASNEGSEGHFIPFSKGVNTHYDT